MKSAGGSLPRNNSIMIMTLGEQDGLRQEGMSEYSLNRKLQNDEGIIRDDMEVRNETLD